MKSDIFYVYEDVCGVFYDIDNNWFVDEDGFVIYNIFELVSPNDVYLFKDKKDYMLVPCVYDPTYGVEIFFPDDEYRLSMISGLLYREE